MRYFLVEVISNGTNEVIEEQPTLTEADIGLFRQPINFSRQAKCTLGSKGVEAVNKALCSDILIHYDELLAISKMSNEEVGVYRAQTGDLKLIETLIDKAAATIMHHNYSAFQTSIHNFLKRLEGKRKNSNNMWGVLVPILGAVNEACTQKDSVRNDAIVKLHRTIQVRLTLLYIQEVAKFSPDQRKKLKKYLIDSTLRPDVDYTSPDFALFYGVNSIERTRSLYLEQKHKFEVMVGGAEKTSIASLQAENVRLFAEIEELMPFIDPFEYYDSNSNIFMQFTADKEDPLSVAVVFRADTRNQFMLTPIAAQFERYLTDGAIKVNINSQGHLEFFYLKLGVAHALPPLAYEALRNFILKNINKYMDSVLNPQPQISSETSIISTPHQQVEPIAAAIREQIQASDSTIQLSPDARKVYFNLKGYSGNRILEALKTLLGPPRITGSHHVFRGLNGRIYPIAIHGSKAVGIGLLKKCLKQWGVDPALLVAILS